MNSTARFQLARRLEVQNATVKACSCCDEAISIEFPDGTIVHLISVDFFNNRNDLKDSGIQEAVNSVKAGLADYYDNYSFSQALENAGIKLPGGGA